MVGGTGVAGAVIVHVDGGTWDHGVGGGTVWSHYFHNGVRHGSTAVGKTTSNSGCVNKILGPMHPQ
ncbi:MULTISPECIES: lactococcin 972 family bacteriocin [Corynebacterium]|uniref:lactococcin 972 family bacteriocin n=1 Tax=Corynebacterium TaxID=1716 RepID=UPI001CCDB79B|nr:MULTISPECIES: lactococcin 972 family bacteriocin [Corynebacterium]UBI01946.1 lactococcin 972 family bacteriocin [Corynebacterium freneyi]